MTRQRHIYNTEAKCISHVTCVAHKTVWSVRLAAAAAFGPLPLPPPVVVSFIMRNNAGKLGVVGEGHKQEKIEYLDKKQFVMGYPMCDCDSIAARRRRRNSARRTPTIIGHD